MNNISWTNWTYWRRNGEKWVKGQVIDGQVVYEEETKLTTMEETKRIYQSEIERVEEAIRRWRKEPGDKDWIWRSRRDFLWSRREELEEVLKHADS